MKQSASIKLTVDRLRPGIYIKLPVRWNAHPFMFNQFKITSDSQITLLKQANISHVYAVPSKSSTDPLPVDSNLPSVVVDNLADSFLLEQKKTVKDNKILAMKSHRRAIKECESQYQNALSQMRALSIKIKDRTEVAVDEAIAVIDMLSQSICHKKDLVLHLVSDQREGMDAHQHAVSVAIISMMIGKTLGLKESEIIDIGLAGLLHDIGKLKIPQEFYPSKTTQSNKPCFVIEKHPEYSVEILNNAPAINNAVKQIVIEHHEFADGSGYPHGLIKGQLHPHSLIVAMVNYYDNLCHGTAGTKPVTPSQGLAHIFSKKKELFDETQISSFIKSLGIYPPGTFVKLDNGHVGIVITVNTSKLLSPSVMIFDETIPRDDAAIINLEEEDISIDTALSPRSLNENVRNYLNPCSQLSFFIE